MLTTAYVLAQENTSRETCIIKLKTPLYVRDARTVWHMCTCWAVFCTHTATDVMKKIYCNLFIHLCFLGPVRLYSVTLPRDAGASVWRPMPPSRCSTWVKTQIRLMGCINSLDNSQKICAADGSWTQDLMFTTIIRWPFGGNLQWEVIKEKWFYMKVKYFYASVMWPVTNNVMYVYVVYSKEKRERGEKEHNDIQVYYFSLFLSIGVRA